MVELLSQRSLSDFAKHDHSCEQFPYYHLVPKGIPENLQFRADLISRWSKTRGDRQMLWNMCARDLLFYVNAFVWTYDPRRVSTGDNPVVPFVTWSCQDEVLSEMCKSIGVEDMVLRKSRDMGASWMGIVVFEWRWHFSKMRESYMMVSRIGDLVDNKDDPDALFSKLDFIHEWQREMPWLLPRMHRRDMLFLNQQTGTVISGARTTGDAGRGGRRTAFFIDEHNAFSISDGFAVMSATQSNTDCRIINGTTKGVGSAFHRESNNPDKKKLTLWWYQHPTKANGLYVDVTGRRRSPWYDRECKRATNVRVDIHAELDGDFHSAEYQFYDTEMLRELIKETCCGPYVEGVLDFDPESCEPGEFTESASGRSASGGLRLWCHLAPDRRPLQHGSYVMGMDVSQGTEASNSCISVVDGRTGEKVAELATNLLDPPDFAKLALAVAYWFGGFIEKQTHMIWEANGPGRSFGRVIVDSGYRNIYYRGNEEKLVDVGTDFPGWWASVKTRYALHSDYRKALKGRRFVNRSEAALTECGAYKHTQQSDVLHVGAENAIDPTAARDNHGDLAVADALANLGMKKKYGSASGGLEKPKNAEPLVLPMGSFKERQHEHLLLSQDRVGRW